MKVGKTTPASHGVVVDEHFLQAQEVPGRLGRVGRLGAGSGFFQRRFEHDAPHDQQRGDRDHADQFAVDQIRPDQHLLVLVVLEHRQRTLAVPLGQPPVVFDGLREVEPGEAADQVQQRHDRHVVGLADDLPEVVIGHRQGHEQYGDVEQHPADGRLDQELAESQHRDGAGDREHEVGHRVGHHEVDGRLERTTGLQHQREPVDVVLVAPTDMHEAQDQQCGGVECPEGGAGQLDVQHRHRHVPVFLVDADRPPEVHRAQHQVEPAQPLQDCGGQVGVRIDERVDVHEGCYGCRGITTAG